MTMKNVSETDQPLSGEALIRAGIAALESQIAARESLKPCPECGEAVSIRYHVGCKDDCHAFAVTCSTIEEVAESWNKGAEAWSNNISRVGKVSLALPPSKPRTYIDFKVARSLAKAGKIVRREKTERGLYLTSTGRISLYTTFLPSGKENIRISDEDIDATDWYVVEDMQRPLKETCNCCVYEPF
jgi:hypothetical protein